MDTLTLLGKRIHNLREEKRLTQEELEERTGINARYISAVECGRRNITVKTLEKIAEGLEVEVYELFLYKSQEKPEEALRRGIETLLRKADKKKLKVYFDILRGIISVE